MYLCRRFWLLAGVASGAAMWAAGWGWGSLALGQVLDHVQWQREDDGGVVLGCDLAECLQVPQLQGSR